MHYLCIHLFINSFIKYLNVLKNICTEYVQCLCFDLYVIFSLFNYEVSDFFNEKYFLTLIMSLKK